MRLDGFEWMRSDYAKVAFYPFFIFNPMDILNVASELFDEEKEATTRSVWA